MRGVIDSEDLPLNISREMLQNNAQVAQIRKAVATRVVSELETLATKEPDKFAKIWEAFGSVLKEGIYEDHDRRAQLLGLARFHTTKGCRQAMRPCGPEGLRRRLQAGPDRDLLPDRRQPRPHQVEPEAGGGEGARRSEVLLLADLCRFVLDGGAAHAFDGKPLRNR